MASTIEKIKQLREETAAGMMDVKQALEESEGCLLYTSDAPTKRIV